MRSSMTHFAQNAAQCAHVRAISADKHGTANPLPQQPPSSSPLTDQVRIELVVVHAPRRLRRRCCRCRKHVPRALCLCSLARQALGTEHLDTRRCLGGGRCRHPVVFPRVPALTAPAPAAAAAAAAPRSPVPVPVMMVPVRPSRLRCARGHAGCGGCSVPFPDRYYGTRACTSRSRR